MPRLIDNPRDLDSIFDGLEIGDWAFYDSDRAIFIRLPKGNVCLLPLSTESATYRQGGPIWGWDGNREAPTLTPSIHDLGTGWHGYMRAGRLESV